MKFGKEISGLASGDPWAPFYLDYKGLKKIINSLAKGRPLDAALLAAVHRPRRIEDTEYNLLPFQPDESTLLQTHRAAFFFKLERELEKINEFYLNKEAESKLRLQNLIDKRKRLQEAVVQSGFHLNRGSSSFVALHEGFRFFERDLAKLQAFIDVNATGFRKILKKWDKRSKSATKELYLSRQVEAQPCFNRAFITELSDASTANIQKLQQLSETDLSSLASNQDPAVDSLPATQAVSAQSITQLDFLDDLEIALERAVVARDGESTKGLLSALPLATTQDQRARIQRLLWRMLSLSLAGANVLPPELLDFDYVDDIDSRTCLHEIARLGLSDLVQVALDRGASLLAKDVFLRQPLHYAAMNGFTAALRILLSHGAPNELDGDGQSPLSYAVINGHLEAVSALLQQQQETDPRLLHLASQHGHAEICQLLLSFHFPIVPDNAGYYPQHLAARSGHADCLRLLLEMGKADRNQIDKYANWTALTHASTGGHSDCVRILLEAGARIDLQDDAGRTAVHWAAWRGHIDCLNLLLLAKRQSAGLVKSLEQQSKSPGTEGSSGGRSPLDLADEADLIPDLSLPPPIIPFRVYGHNYLDNRSLVQISLGHTNTSHANRPAVSFAEADRAVPLKVVVSCLSDSFTMPHTCALDDSVAEPPFSFQVSHMGQLVLAFDLFPIHGSRMVGRALAPPAMLVNATRNARAISLPIMDHQLNSLGEINFELAAVTAFAAAELAPGGQLQTYWKSSAPQTTQQSGQVVASSLQGEYIKVVVQVTKDGEPVAWPNWHLPISGINVAITDLTLAQFQSLAKSQHKELARPSTDSAREWYSAISEAMVTLAEILRDIPTHMGINIELRYPTLSDIERLSLNSNANANEVIDSVLTAVYEANKRDAAAASQDQGGRRIVFSSFNPLVATALNWKQPNYAVFFASYCGLSRSAPEGKMLPANRQESDKRCTTIREAVKFAKSNNLLGVIFDSTIFKQVPTLVDATKDYGLLLVTFGFESRDTLKLGSDAHLEDGVMTYASQRFLDAV